MPKLLSRLRGCICLLTCGDGCIIKGLLQRKASQKYRKPQQPATFSPFFVLFFFFSRFQAVIKCTPLVWVVGSVRSKTMSEFQWRIGQEWVREAAIKADVDGGLLALGKATTLCLFLLLINIGRTFRLFFILAFWPLPLTRCQDSLKARGNPANAAELQIGWASVGGLIPIKHTNLSLA